jgi:salicylate hydroxylase
LNIDRSLCSNGHRTASQPLRIAIIGGGIGGLSLLLGILHRDPESKHISPHLYESAPAFSEIGAGVGFGPNSVQAMKLIDPRLHAAYNRIAADAEPSAEARGEEMFVWNHFYMGMDGRASQGESSGPNRLKAGDRIASVYNYNRKKNVHRATFLNEMISLLPSGTGEGKVTFRKRLADVVDLGDNGVEMQFTDGTSEIADAVIGCDGVKSRIRQILLEGHDSVEPRFTGKYAYRGLIPMKEAAKAIGEIARNSHMTCGYGGHLVNFPVDKGQTLNVVAFQTKKDGKWDHGKEWVVPATIDDVLEDYQGWSESVRNLLSMLKKPDKWGLFEHMPARTYHRGGKICLLGDCAHASTPHQGAGAGMAIEDAAVLSSLLGSVKGQDSSELERAFRAYDAVRRPRTQRLVTTSRDAGMLYDLQKEGVGDDPELVKRDLLERMKWVWDLDLAQHCEQAVELLDK